MSIESKLKEIILLDEIQVVFKLIDLNFIKQSMKCTSCNILMKLKKSKDSMDFYNWRCMNFECSKYQSTLSIRNSSWLKNITICPKRPCKILLFWSKGLSRKEILDLVEVSIKISTKIRKFLLVKIQMFYHENLFV